MMYIKPSIQNRIVEVIAALLIALFAYTAINKLAAYTFTKQQLLLYPIIKHFYSTVAWALPVVELIVVMLLIIPRTRITGLWASFGLMVSFTLYLFYMVSQFGKDLPCSCGGVISKMTWEQHKWFNIGFILIILFGLWVHYKGLKAFKRKMGTKEVLY